MNNDDIKRIKKAEYMKKWAEKNKEHLKEYNKQYRESEKGKEIRKKYYQSHKDEIYAQQTEYRRKNSKRISRLVINNKRKRADKMKEQGIKNAWSVINYKEEPRYYSLPRGRKRKDYKANNNENELER